MALDDVLDFGKTLLGGIDWTKVIMGGAGQLYADRKNRRAAETVRRGSEQIQQAARESALENIRAQEEALERARPSFDQASQRFDRANERLGQVARSAEPDLQTGTGHFRRIVAEDPDVLTPAQLLALQDAKRVVLNSPVLRTSGRGTTAAVADLTRRHQAGATEANRARQDRAAAQLAARGRDAVAARTAQAGVDQRQASVDLARANAEIGGGRAAGTALQNAGNIGANAAGDAFNASAQADLASGQSALDVLSRVLASSGNAAPVATPQQPSQPVVADSSSPVSMLASIIADGNKDKYKSRYLREGAEV